MANSSNPHDCVGDSHDRSRITDDSGQFANSIRILITPQYDVNIGTWVAPFFMGAVNTRIVRRSCALSEQYRESYGRGFSYQEYLKFDPPWAWLQSAGMVAGLALVGGVIQVPWLRPFLQSIIPQPGCGPPEQMMNEGWFRCELLGWGSEGQRVRGLIADVGDPGNLCYC